MNCAEFRRVLPDLSGDGQKIEQHEHVKTCAECFDLVSDLESISDGARLLREAEEPNPRVWNSIEIALRQEGLIREARPQPFLVPALSRRWGRIWLLPLAAMFLITFGLIIYQRGSGEPQIAEQTGSGTVVANVEDQQLLEMVAARAPSMRAAYEADLKNVNAYIRDAQVSVNNDPNDEEARQSLMEAYDQQSMVYEMALDRSLR